MKLLNCLLLLFVFPVSGGNEVAEFLGKQTAKKRTAPTVIDDLSFLRRAYLDITGTLPSDTAMDAFLQSTRADKRDRLVNQLLNSDAYVDRWTTFYRDLFGNRLLVEQAFFRNSFHAYMRDNIRHDKGWDQMAKGILTAQGTGVGGQSPFFFWLLEQFDDPYRLDFLDDQVTYISETMLGIRTGCISCHDGAYHLEEVNKDLSKRTRQDFWEMAAFLSSSYLYEQAYDEDDYEDEEVAFLSNLAVVDTDKSGFEVGEGYIYADPDQSDGQYRANSSAGDGMRPPRNGGLIQPQYMFGGGAPLPGETRREALARLLTADRQFARNMVNRIWAHFFGEGFVEPLDAWDLNRLDTATATTNGTTVQPRNPELLEWLTQSFIDNDYKLKPLIRLICSTEVYQWDYRKAPDESTSPLAHWRGKQRMRRLEAEAIVDGMHHVLGQSYFQYMVTGRLDKVFRSTWALPGLIEPNIGAIFTEASDEPIVDVTNYGYDSLDTYFYMQYSIMDLLDTLGRGNFDSMTPRDNSSQVQGILALLNSEEHNFWIEEWEFAPTISTLAEDVDEDRKTNEQAVETLFVKILFRQPTQAERTRLTNHFQNREPAQALADIAWALINHPDFLYK